jgi:hypothetical protein
VLTSGGSHVIHTRPDPHNADEFGQVLPFRHRPGQSSLPVSASDPAKTAIEPGDDLARFEQDPDEPADERQRMLMNFIAIAIVTLLVGTGVWIADTIADIQNDQDCVLQGRSNCAPIEAPGLKVQ